MPEKYLLGPGLVSKLGQMVERFDGSSESGGAPTPIRTRFEEPLRRSSPGGFKACTFTGGWGFNSSQTVRSISSGETFNATNVIYDIPNTGLTLNCVIGKDGTQWYLANVQHQSTNVLTRVAIEGASFVFSAASVQVIGVTSQKIAFGLDACDEYTNSAATTAAALSQVASFSATSYFFG
jgi:hypothetical protein